MDIANKPQNSVNSNIETRVKEKKVKKGLGVSDDIADGQGVDKIASSDYKIDILGRKHRARFIVFNKGEDDGKKEVSEMNNAQKNMTFNTFVEAVEFLTCLDEQVFYSLMEEGFDSFMEEFEQLSELDKKTLGSYVKKATCGMNGIASNALQGGAATPGSKERKTFITKMHKRVDGMLKATDRLSK